MRGAVCAWRCAVLGAARASLLQGAQLFWAAETTVCTRAG